MIEFEINPKYYKEIHNAIIAVDDECRMDFAKSGVSSSIVDPANVMIGIIDIPKKVFESFKVSESIQIGYEWFYLFKTNAERTMFLNSKVNHKFQIMQVDGVSSEYSETHALIEYDIFSERITQPNNESIRKKPKVPELDLPCRFGLPVSFLRKIVKRGEDIQFNVNENDTNLVCSGSPNWETKPISVDVSDNASGKYSTEYLQGIVKAIPKNVKAVTVNMGVDYPCTIEFKICDGKVPVKYLLAPRIESD